MAPHSSTLAWKIPWIGAWKAEVHGVAEGRTRLSDFTLTFHFHALEKEMATHSTVLAWRILGISDPGGLMSMGTHRVGHNWSDLTAAAVYVCLYINILKQLLSKKCFLQWFKWFLNFYFKRKFTFLISHSLNSRTIIIISLSVLSNQLIFKKDTRKSL